MICIFLISKCSWCAIILCVFKSLMCWPHSQRFFILYFANLSLTHLYLSLLILIMQLDKFILNLSAFRFKIILTIESKSSLIKKWCNCRIEWCLSLMIHKWSVCNIECLIHLKQLASFKFFLYKIFSLSYNLFLYHLFFYIKL